MPSVGSLAGMAAPLALEGIAVEKDGSPLAGGPNIGINVRANVLRVYDRGTLVTEEAGVAAVTRVDRRTYNVTMVAGAVYHVSILKRCGCGGGR